MEIVLGDPSPSMPSTPGSTIGRCSDRRGRSIRSGCADAIGGRGAWYVAGPEAVGGRRGTRLAPFMLVFDGEWLRSRWTAWLGARDERALDEEVRGSATRSARCCPTPWRSGCPVSLVGI